MRDLNLWKRRSMQEGKENKKIPVVCSRSPKNLNLVTSRGCFAGEGKKCTKT